MSSDPRYPLGPFTFEGPSTAGQRAGWIDHIAEAPTRLRAAVPVEVSVRLLEALHERWAPLLRPPSPP